ncbi:MAG: CDP-diacylglycerol--serine O-phosphatidyltransferase [Bacteroidetes bacterium]|nr:CDP-diacylglycerol--serine O-phosphatidyltransferase [Bacteroidota bacterium]
MKKHIPNLFTLLNLSCGTVAIVFAIEGQWQWSVYLLLAAALFDFMDGMAARLLNAASETGKQLDSLSDMVSFGLLPAIFVYIIFRQQFIAADDSLYPRTIQWLMLLSVLMIPALSAIRLARFNLEETGAAFFHGLPTPAHALFWTGLYWQFMNEGLLFGTQVNLYFLWAIMVIMAFYMILPVPMYSLKFKHFRLKGNLIRYILLAMAVVILAFTGLPGIALVILTYILLSLLNLLLTLR